MIKIIILNVFLIFPIFSIAQQYGCTDLQAQNYDPEAKQNDGSCLYDPALVEATFTFPLSDTLNETSGLILWENLLWTHNDDTDTHLYALDTIDGSIVRKYQLPGVKNVDWEEIAHDEGYIYIGDFGNNARGNRTDLKILRVDKKSLLDEAPKIDSIHFSYSGQIDFTSPGPNNTDFDCEAFIVTHDSIYLFTKEWISNKTTLYVLPKIPGEHVAQKRAVLDVEGLVTGSVYFSHLRIIALSGYDLLLQPFIFLLYDFTGNDFFGGNKRRIQVSLPFHQIEGITSENGIKYYLSNEHFSRPPFINVPQRLHIIDMSEYLAEYVNNQTLSIPDPSSGSYVFPNPASNYIQVSNISGTREYEMFSMDGKPVGQGYLFGTMDLIPIKNLPQGMYVLRLPGEHPFTFVKW